MLVEEARVETAHVMVTLHAAVHDSSIALLSNAFFCDFMINPVGITPHAPVDFAKLCLSSRVVLYGVFELLLEITIV